MLLNVIKNKVLPQSIGIGIGSTFCQRIVIGIDNSFHRYC